MEKKITDHKHDKCITNQEFNKVTAEILDLSLRRANLASKSDTANFINKTNFESKKRYIK